MIDFIAIYEFNFAYSVIRKGAGEKEAKYFAKRFSMAALDVLKSTLVTDILHNWKEAGDLERLLENIDDKYKKMLKEMGDKKQGDKGEGK